MRGYRAMWHTLRLDYGIQAPRRKVEGILQQVEPEGTALRKVYALRRRSYTNPGPNFAWQIDDYDKAFLFMVRWTVSVIESCG